jgi:exodeoxyribonuclease V alpha subunit
MTPSRDREPALPGAAATVTPRPAPPLPGSTPMPLSSTGTARAAFRHATAAVGARHSSTEQPVELLPLALCLRLQAEDVAETTVWVGHELAASCVHSSLHERRAIAVLAMALATAMEAGDVYLPLDPARLPTALARLLGEAPADPLTVELAIEPAIELFSGVSALARELGAGRIPATVAHLFGGPGARAPFVVAGERLYAERVWWMEQRVLHALHPRLLDASSTVADRAAIDAALERPQPGLTPEQRRAVELGLTRRLALITGGPGTGKTWSVVALLRTLGALGVRPEDIALAAPTGRAAQRITESLRASGAELDARLGDATTLHRLIGIAEDRLGGLDRQVPTFHAGWKLPQRFVIVDEASMIDLPLMDALLAALHAEATLVLLGDADQLPSVELGAVFRDLVVGVPPGSVARLARSHRAGGGDPTTGAELLAAAAAINRGEVTTPGIPTPFRWVPDPVALAFRGAEGLPHTALPAFLTRWWRDTLQGNAALGRAVDLCFPLLDGRLTGAEAAQLGDEIARLIAIHARARVLCLTRLSPWEGSTAFVNQTLHRLCRRAAATRGTRAAAAAAQGQVVPGAPVIFLSNDYGRGLFNGDLGVVVRSAPPDRGAAESLSVAFARPHSPGGLLWYPFDELRARLELAFALTVHKAQGSEYDAVAVVLPPRDIPLLSREILYTALTRARRSVVMVGDPALLALGAGRPRSRLSSLAFPPPGFRP